MPQTSGRGARKSRNFDATAGKLRFERPTNVRRVRPNSNTRADETPGSKRGTLPPQCLAILAPRRRGVVLGGRQSHPVQQRATRSPPAAGSGSSHCAPASGSPGLSPRSVTPAAEAGGACGGRATCGAAASRGPGGQMGPAAAQRVRYCLEQTTRCAQRRPPTVPETPAVVRPGGVNTNFGNAPHRTHR